MENSFTPAIVVQQWKKRLLLLNRFELYRVVDVVIGWHDAHCIRHWLCQSQLRQNRLQSVAHSRLCTLVATTHNAQNPIHLHPFVFRAVFFCCCFVAIHFVDDFVNVIEWVRWCSRFYLFSLHRIIAEPKTTANKRLRRLFLVWEIHIIGARVLILPFSLTLDWINTDGYDTRHKRTSHKRRWK